MIAIVVAEFKQWNANYRIRTLGILILIVALAGCFGLLRPEFCFLGLAAGSLWLGIKAGDQAWCEAKIMDWVVNTQFAPVRIVTGKILAIVLLFFCHYLILTPLIIIMTLLWGVGCWDVVAVSILILIVTLIHAGNGLIFSIADSIYTYIGSRILIAGWLVVTFLIPPVRIVNPFWQIWLMTAPASQERIWSGVLINIGCLLLLFGMIILAVGREVKRKNERRINL